MFTLSKVLMLITSVIFTIGAIKGCSIDTNTADNGDGGNMQEVPILTCKLLFPFVGKIIHIPKHIGRDTWMIYF